MEANDLVDANALMDAADPIEAAEPTEAADIVEAGSALDPDEPSDAALDDAKLVLAVLGGVGVLGLGAYIHHYFARQHRRDSEAGAVGGCTPDVASSFAQLRAFFGSDETLAGADTCLSLTSVSEVSDYLSGNWALFSESTRASLRSLPDVCERVLNHWHDYSPDAQAAIRENWLPLEIRDHFDSARESAGLTAEVSRGRPDTAKPKAKPRRKR